jgi:hypothetical protein
VESIPEFFDDGFPIRFEIADGTQFNELRPRHPYFAVCQCSNREFRVEFPQAVCTVIVCTKCGAKGCVHEG